MSFRQTEPSDIDHAPDVSRADDALREQRWAAFVAEVHTYKRGVSWGTVVAGVADAMAGYQCDEFGCRC